MDRNAEINYLLAELEAVEEYGLIQEVKDAFQQLVRDGVLLGHHVPTALRARGDC